MFAADFAEGLGVIGFCRQALVIQALNGQPPLGFWLSEAVFNQSGNWLSSNRV